MLSSGSCPPPLPVSFSQAFSLTAMWCSVDGWNARRSLIPSFTYPLTAGVVGAPQMTVQPVFSIFLCFPLPSGTLRTPGLVRSQMLSSHLFLCLPRLLPPFTVPCTMVSTRPDERETCPYHFSLRLFTMLRRSPCGPFVCWILAQTSSYVTWCLYEIRNILW